MYVCSMPYLKRYKGIHFKPSRKQENLDVKAGICLGYETNNNRNITFSLKCCNTYKTKMGCKFTTKIICTLIKS